jgi:AcrR family transcriptional regulator
MSPRPYQLGRRQATVEQTRTRILDAARDLLETPEGPASFSVDAIAKHADVARMTIYYQFNSKAGLLEALFDDLANRGGMDRLPEAFRQPEALEALDTFIAIFGQFYASHRLIDRRLRGLALLDQDLARALAARNERRRTGLTVLLQRLAEQRGQPGPRERDEAVAILHMLTSFESFDILAGDAGSPADVVPLVQRVAHAALGLAPRPGLPSKPAPSDYPATGTPESGDASIRCD